MGNRHSGPDEAADGNQAESIRRLPIELPEAGQALAVTRTAVLIA
jgi:hypothetical protein